MGDPTISAPAAAPSEDKPYRRAACYSPEVVDRPFQPGRLRWLRIFSVWHERIRQRYALSTLDERLLKDVGITRAEAARECAKPFWRK